MLTPSRAQDRSWKWADCPLDTCGLRAVLKAGRLGMGLLPVAVWELHKATGGSNVAGFGVSRLCGFTVRVGRHPGQEGTSSLLIWDITDARPEVGGRERKVRFINCPRALGLL